VTERFVWLWLSVPTKQKRGCSEHSPISSRAPFKFSRKMAATSPRGPPTHVRSFGTPLDVEGDAEPPRENPGAAVRQILGRISFSSLRGRPSVVNHGAQNSPPTPSAERAPIPTMMQSSGEAYMTPLPKLSMIVLSIVSASILR